ncbi:MAG: hypothetical protein II972_04960, partial [Elusimicrobiaceae bacterium]|nr:hypothetical protein [Elusimicrobiaceae bacterium]
EASGQRATGSTFESEYFTYRVYGDDKAVALATRKNVDEDKKYELSVDYKTNKLYCRPITNKTCIDLHLEEGQDYSQVPWEDCLFAAAVIKNPISCYTRNNNGAQERMECFDNGECEFISEMEGYKFYAECYATDTENGFCTSYYNMYESTREEDEESIWTHTRLCNRMRGLECLEWGDTIDNFYWKNPIK